MQTLKQLILGEAGKRGSYYAPFGSRRQYEIEFGPGRHLNEVLQEIFSVFEQRVGPDYDKYRVNQEARKLLATKCASITMWTTNDEAIMSFRYSYSDDQFNQIVWDSFSKVILKDLEDFGLTGSYRKTLRQREKVKKGEVIVRDDEDTDDEVRVVKDIPVGGTSEEEGIYRYKKAYETGNIKLSFVEDIRALDLKEFLSLSKGYDVAGTNMEDEDEDN